MKDADYYEQFRIKRYLFWDLFVHPKQGDYLGRVYAWTRRNPGKYKDASDMPVLDNLELFFRILPSWQRAIKHLFPNLIRPNVSIQCNETKVLHAHLIPRFDGPVKYKGKTFTDNKPDANYANEKYRVRKQTDIKILHSLRDELKQRL